MDSPAIRPSSLYPHSSESTTRTGDIRVYLKKDGTLGLKKYHATNSIFTKIRQALSRLFEKNVTYNKGKIRAAIQEKKIKLADYSKGNIVQIFQELYATNIRQKSDPSHQERGFFPQLLRRAKKEKITKSEVLETLSLFRAIEENSYTKGSSSSVHERYIRHVLKKLVIEEMDEELFLKIRDLQLTDQFYGKIAEFISKKSPKTAIEFINCIPTCAKMLPQKLLEKNLEALRGWVAKDAALLREVSPGFLGQHFELIEIAMQNKGDSDEITRGLSQLAECDVEDKKQLLFLILEKYPSYAHCFPASILSDYTDLIQEWILKNPEKLNSLSLCFVEKNARMIAEMIQDHPDKFQKGLVLSTDYARALLWAEQSSSERLSLLKCFSHEFLEREADLIVRLIMDKKEFLSHRGLRLPYKCLNALADLMIEKRPSDGASRFYLERMFEDYGNLNQEALARIVAENFKVLRLLSLSFLEKHPDIIELGLEKHGVIAYDYLVSVCLYRAKPELGQSHLKKALKSSLMTSEELISDACLKQINFESLFDLMTEQEEGKEPFIHILFRKAPRAIRKIYMCRSEEEIKRLDQIQDKKGHPVGMRHLVSLKMKFSDWITKPKLQQGRTPKISDSEYHQRAASLSQKMLALFESLRFGTEEGSIHPHLLGENKSGKKYSKDEVKKALEIMCARIEKKKAWLGTPKADKKNDLHAFYTIMLVNAENVVKTLQTSKDPEQVAGILVGIAKAELEGRCAAAYQGEFEQAVEVLSMEHVQEVQPDQMAQYLDRHLTRVLQRVAEDRIRRCYGGNVHYMNQLSYALGFMSVPDPLCQVTPKKLLEDMLNEFSPEAFLWLCMDQFKDIPQETLFDYFKELTPSGFYPEMALLEQEAKELEDRLKNNAETLLKALGFSERQSDELTAFFLSSAGSPLATLVKSKTSLELKIEKDDLNVEACVDEEKLKELLQAYKGTTPAERLVFEKEIAVIVRKNKLIKRLHEIVGIEINAKTLIQLITIQENMKQEFIDWMSKDQHFEELFIKDNTAPDEPVEAEDKEEMIAQYMVQFGSPFKMIKNSRSLEFARSCFLEDKVLHSRGVQVLFERIGVIF